MTYWLGWNLFRHKTDVSTASTHLMTRIAYPQLPNIQGYNMSTVKKDSFCAIRGLSFHWICLLEEYDRCL